MTPEEAADFYEDDEDPAEIWAKFEAARERGELLYTGPAAEDDVRSLGGAAMSWPDGPLPRIERDDEYANPMFFHDCGGAVKRTFLPLSRETGWWWTEGGDLAPSVYCTTCGTHGWWRGGEWVSA